MLSFDNFLAEKTRIMFLYIFILGFYLNAYNSYKTEVTQINNSIRIYGSCYDINTGIDLKIRAFTLIDNKKLLLGESNNLGQFDFQISNSTKYLSFESEGFKPIFVQANIIEKTKDNSKFIITLPMSAKDSLEVNPINQLSLAFNIPDSINVRYELKKINDLANHTTFNFKQGRHPSNLILKDFLPGEYIMTATSSDGNLLFNEEMTVRPGLNFKGVNITKAGTKAYDASERNKNYITKQFQSTTLYFLQSSYELKNEAQSTLDSIALYLSLQPDMVAHVIGYSDNVGEHNLNVTLSEFRARTIVNYLIRKGVQPDQIIFKWEGPNSPAVLNNSEENRLKNRRAVIHFLKK